jgi:hypothetical protein
LLWNNKSRLLNRYLLRWIFNSLIFSTEQLKIYLFQEISLETFSFLFVTLLNLFPISFTLKLLVIRCRSLMDDSTNYWSFQKFSPISQRLNSHRVTHNFSFKSVFRVNCYCLEAVKRKRSKNTSRNSKIIDCKIKS